MCIRTTESPGFRWGFCFFYLICHPGALNYVRSGCGGDADSPDIREALLQGISDADEHVREEATVELGKRQDLRLSPTFAEHAGCTGIKVTG